MEVVKQWVAFDVDLVRLQAHMLQNLSGNYTGISCCPVLCRFVFTENAEQADIDIINSYWNALAKEIEEATILDRIELAPAMLWKKTSLVFKIWKDMSALERKLILDIALTDEEVSTLLTEYRAQ